MKKYIIIFILLVFNISSAFGYEIVRREPQDSYVYDKSIHYVGNTLPLDVCYYVDGAVDSRFFNDRPNYHGLNYDNHYRDSIIIRVVHPSNNNSGYMILKCCYCRKCNGSGEIRRGNKIISCEEYTHCNNTLTIPFVFMKNEDLQSEIPTPTPPSTLTPTPPPMLTPLPTPTPPSTLTPILDINQEGNQEDLISISHVKLNDVVLNENTFNKGDEIIVSGKGVCKYIRNSNDEEIVVPIDIKTTGIKIRPEGAGQPVNQARNFVPDREWELKYDVVAIDYDKLTFDEKNGLAFAKIEVESGWCGEGFGCENCQKAKQIYFLPIAKENVINRNYLRIVSVRDLNWKNKFISEEGELLKTSLTIPTTNTTMLEGLSDKTVKMGYAVEFEFDTYDLNYNDLSIVLMPTLIKNDSTILSCGEIKDKATGKIIDDKFTQIKLDGSNKEGNKSFLVERVEGDKKYVDTYRWIYYLPPEIEYFGQKESDIITVNFDIDIYVKGKKIFNLKQFDKSNWNGDVFKYSVKETLLNDIYDNTVN